MQTKQERERDFHNEAFTDLRRRRVWGFYDVTRASHERFRGLLAAESPAGKEVLEFGCGLTTQAISLARQGAQVTGIDISDVAVEQARSRAEEHGVSERTHFARKDAEALDFDDDSFDLVCGSAILHHLDLPKAYAQISRVLRSGGAGVFIEPLGHNPAINLFRKRTPELRTSDEHPLVEDDIDLARAYFGEVDTSYFHLAGLMAIPLRKRRAFPKVLNALDAADRGLFKLLPPVRKHGWMVVLRVATPTSLPEDSSRLTAARLD